MNFKIVSDSSSDLLNIDSVDFESVPLKIITDEREYVDNAELDVSAMLEDLAKYKGKSKSSCPNSEEYLRAFGDAEYVFCVTITSGLSGSFNAASVAAKTYTEEHPERRVHVIDSLSTGSENILLIERLAALIKGYKCITKVELLPFKTLCREKYKNLGITFPLEHTEAMPKDRLAELEAYFNECYN